MVSSSVGGSYPQDEAAGVNVTSLPDGAGKFFEKAVVCERCTVATLTVGVFEVVF
jgi:hypothetical protein